MSFWNEERVAELSRLAPNHTAGQIAAKLGAPSRNAVIGKIHRLKLRLNPDRPRGQARPKIKRKSNARAAPVGPLIRRGEGDPSVMSDFGRPGAHMSTIGGLYQCDLVHLSATTCRFPCWGDATPIGERRYCGAMAVDGLPYCHAHCRIAYVGQGCDNLINHSVSPSSSQGESVPVSFATARPLRESSVGSIR